MELPSGLAVFVLELVLVSSVALLCVPTIYPLCWGMSYSAAAVLRTDELRVCITTPRS